MVLGTLLVLLHGDFVSFCGQSKMPFEYYYYYTSHDELLTL